MAACVQMIKRDFIVHSRASRSTKSTIYQIKDVKNKGASDWRALTL